MLICLLAVAWASAQVDSLWYDNGEIEAYAFSSLWEGVYFDLNDFGLESFELTQVHLTVHKPFADDTVSFQIWSNDSLSMDSLLTSHVFEVEAGAGYQEIVWELDEPLTMNDIFWVVQFDAPHSNHAGLTYDTDGPSGHSYWWDDYEWVPYPYWGDFLIRCYGVDMELSPTTWGAIKAMQ